MQLNDLFRSLRRRWYLVVAVLLLAVLGCTAVASLVPVQYTMKAQFVLIPPRSPEDPSANRYLGLGGMGESVDVLVRTIDAASVHDEIQKQVPGATFTVAADPTTSAPVVAVTGEADQAGPARAAMRAVAAQVPQKLSALQEALGIKSSARVTSLTIASDVEPQASQKSRVRAVAAAGVALLGVGLVLVALIDGILLRRRGGAAPDDDRSITLAPASPEQAKAPSRTRRVPPARPSTPATGRVQPRRAEVDDARAQ